MTSLLNKKLANFTLYSIQGKTITYPYFGSTLSTQLQIKLLQQKEQEI